MPSLLNDKPKDLQIGDTDPNFPGWKVGLVGGENAWNPPAAESKPNAYMPIANAAELERLLDGKVHAIYAGGISDKSSNANDASTVVGDNVPFVFSDEESITFTGNTHRVDINTTSTAPELHIFASVRVSHTGTFSVFGGAANTFIPLAHPTLVGADVSRLNGVSDIPFIINGKSVFGARTDVFEAFEGGSEFVRVEVPSIPSGTSISVGDHQSNNAYSFYGDWGRTVVVNAELTDVEKFYLESYQEYGFTEKQEQDVQDARLDALELINSPVSEVLLMRQDTTNNAVFTVAEAMNFPATDPVVAEKYSIMDQLEDYRKDDGTFEFIYRNPDNNFERRWTQTSNPLDAEDTITGFNLISETHADSSFIGLVYEGADHPSSTFSGNVGNSWWTSIGTKTLYQGSNIPIRLTGSVIVGKVAELYAVTQGGLSLDDVNSRLESLETQSEPSIPEIFNITQIEPATNIRVFNWNTGNANQISSDAFYVTDDPNSFTPLESIAIPNGDTKTLYLVGPISSADNGGVEFTATNIDGALSTNHVRQRYLGNGTPTWATTTFNQLVNSNATVGVIEQDSVDYIFTASTASLLETDTEARLEALECKEETVSLTAWVHTGAVTGTSVVVLGSAGGNGGSTVHEYTPKNLNKQHTLNFNYGLNADSAAGLDARVEVLDGTTVIASDLFTAVSASNVAGSLDFYPATDNISVVITDVRGASNRDLRLSSISITSKCSSFATGILKQATEAFTSTNGVDVAKDDWYTWYPNGQRFAEQKPQYIVESDAGVSRTGPRHTEITAINNTTIVTGHDLTKTDGDGSGLILKIQYVDANNAHVWTPQEYDVFTLIQRSRADKADGVDNTSDSSSTLYDNDWIRIDVIDEATGTLKFVDSGREMSYVWSELYVVANEIKKVGELWFGTSTSNVPNNVLLDGTIFNDSEYPDLLSLNLEFITDNGDGTHTVDWGEDYPKPIRDVSQLGIHVDDTTAANNLSVITRLARSTNTPTGGGAWRLTGGGNSVAVSGSVTSPDGEETEPNHRGVLLGVWAK